MKKNSLTIKSLSFFLLISLLLHAALLVFFSKSKETLTKDKEQNSVITEAKIEAKVIAKSVDHKGYSKTVFERQQEIVGNGDISKLPVSQSVIDSLRLDGLAKGAKLKQADLIVATLRIEKAKAIKKVDSLQHTSYVYTDDFATAKFTPDTTGGTFDFNYRISLIKQDYAKRKWFLGAKTNYTDILSPDKRITINGLQSLSIATPSKSRLGLALTAAYAYDLENKDFKPVVGIGLSYQFVRF